MRGKLFDDTEENYLTKKDKFDEEFENGPGFNQEAEKHDPERPAPAHADARGIIEGGDRDIQTRSPGSPIAAPQAIWRACAGVADIPDICASAARFESLGWCAMGRVSAGGRQGQAL